MRNEPVLSASIVSGAIIALLSVFGVVLDAGALETIVAALLPVVAALAARTKVTPTG